MEIEVTAGKRKVYLNISVFDILVFGIGETVNSLELFSKVESLGA